MRNILLGFFLMPMLPLMLVDVLVFTRGLDAFKDFETVQAVIKSAHQERVSIRTTSGGSPAAYEVRIRPAVTYEFELEGKRRWASRYFLFDHDKFSDPPERASDPESITQQVLSKVKPGQVIAVRVARSNPSISYVEIGWDSLWRTVRFWLMNYALIAALLSIGYVLIAVAKASRSKPGAH